MYGNQLIVTYTRRKTGIAFLGGISLASGLAKEAHNMYAGMQARAFSSRLGHSRCVTVLRDQFQDYIFASTFFHLHDLPAGFVGLQEFGLAHIFLQFYKSEHCVLAGIQSAQAEMAARISRISLVKIRP